MVRRRPVPSRIQIQTNQGSSAVLRIHRSSSATKEPSQSELERGRECQLDDLETTNATRTRGVFLFLGTSRWLSPLLIPRIHRAELGAFGIPKFVELEIAGTIQLLEDIRSTKVGNPGRPLSFGI